MGRQRTNVRKKRNRLQRSFYLPKKTSKMGESMKFLNMLEKEDALNTQKVKRHEITLTDQEDFNNKLAVPIQSALKRLNNHLTNTLGYPPMNLPKKSLPDCEWVSNVLSNNFFLIIYFRTIRS